MPRSSTSTGSGSTAALAWAILVHLLKGRKKPGPCSGAPLLSTLSAVPTSGRERRKSSGAVRLIAREARSMLKLATTVSSTCTGVTTGWVPPMVTKRDRRRAASAWSMVVERLIMHRCLTPSVPRLGRSSSASDSGPESGGCSEPEEGAELGGGVHRAPSLSSWLSLAGGLAGGFGRRGINGSSHGRSCSIRGGRWVPSHMTESDTPRGPRRCEPVRAIGRTMPGLRTAEAKCWTVTRSSPVVRRKTVEALASEVLGDTSTGRLLSLRRVASSRAATLNQLPAIVR
jgi:hypothetical protein